jgi:hypothetical protein
MAVRIVLALFAFAFAGECAELRAGAARVKITPPAGTPMAGYYYQREATGIHDDLWASALVLEQGGVKVALVSCDIIDMPRGIASAARSKAEVGSGVPAANIMISGTHAHTGPVIAGGEDIYVLPPDGIAKVRSYEAMLVERIAESVKLAAAALQPAHVLQTAGREDSLLFNRRFFMKDGSVGWNPGKLNPAIVRVAGPVDPDVPLVAVTKPDGAPLAAYVNYAMHLDTVGGTMISADYPYTVTEILSRAKGSGLVTLFTMGCSGNVNHLDVTSKAPQKGNEEAARIGAVLAAAALKSWNTLVPAVGKIQIATKPVPLAVNPHDPSDVPWARRAASETAAGRPAPFMDQVKAFRVLDVESRQGKAWENEVQVISIGRDIAWVGLSGEIFTEVGIAIKRSSPFKRTIVVSLANGNVGYVPNREAYPQGNYEVVSARVAQGSGERLVDAALELLNELNQKAER